VPKPGPAAAEAVLATYLPLDAPPESVDLLLIRICMGEGWETSETAAAERAYRWKGQFLARLRQRLDRSEREGRPCRNALNTSDESLVQGYCFEEPNDSATTAEAKRRRLLADEVLNHIASLTHSEFEMLCAVIAEELGAHSPTVTSYGHDEGIDFFGRVEWSVLQEFPLPNVNRQLGVWIVGQAKHYDRTQVATPDIRELVGSVYLARSAAFSKDNPPAFANLAIRACDAVFCFFVTSGDISRDGWMLLRTSGVIGMDGEMLGAFLADRGIGVTDEGNFDATLLRQRIGA
jgi:restriction endonuclease Mrr